jgi:hypothetical protein
VPSSLPDPTALTAPLETDIQANNDASVAQPPNTATPISDPGDLPEEDGPQSPGDDELLRLARAAETQAVSFAQINWRPAQERSYKAFRSEFVDTSKYKSDDYRHRSKLFRPKTRIGVTKNLASAAQTLFNTVDAVTVTAGDESNPMQVAAAAINKALVNYRLDRTNGKNAISWFLTAMGALQDCNIAGVCCSKTYWQYEEHAQNGTPIKDRPEIELVPPENLGLDPAGAWIDPVQSGAYFYVKYPMHIADVKRKMRDPRRGWRPLPADANGNIDDNAFTTAKVKEFDAASVRRAREGGTDRMDNSTVSDRDYEMVWVVEWFIRDEDEDWNFWTLGSSHMLSDPEPTAHAYPHKGGERPYRLGYGNLEAHRIVPQSPVETWNSLQQELNDITNLRLDTLKQVIQPVAKVIRGKKVDTDALKRRYPIVYVSSMDDVEWDRPPDSAASSFAETSRIDTDFDDLAGNFNGGSVANNRQVGETVGGMRLMQGAASATSEFYTRLWVETWVEPVLADVSKLEAFYESDEKILALAKKQANARMEDQQIGEITDELLKEEVTLRVSAGLGSPDPQAKMAKMAGALQQMEPVVKLDRRFMTGEIRPKTEAITDEIFGNAGIKDGFDRFFEYGEAMPMPGEQPEANPDADPAVLADKQKDRASKEKIAREKNKADIVKTLISSKADQRYQYREQKDSGKHKFIDVMMQALGEQQAQADREAERQAMASQPKPSFPA